MTELKKPKNKFDLIEGNVYSVLGDSVDIRQDEFNLPRELNISSADVNNALLEYYQNVPIKRTRNYTAVNVRELKQDFEELYQTDDEFYVGVLDFYIKHQMSTMGGLDSFLLGSMLPGQIPTITGIKGGPMGVLLDNTITDMVVGDPYYEEDELEKCIKWVVGGYGVLSVIYGVGTWDVERTPHRHLPAVSWLVGKYYYERVLSIRKTGKFEKTDFSLDVSQLESSLQRAKEMSHEYLNSIKYMPITRG
jgi:hypothetical protein